MNKRERLFHPTGVFGISNIWWAEIDTHVQDGEISWKKDKREYAKIRLSGDLGDIRICKIQMDKDDRNFVRAFGSNWYFDEFMRIGGAYE